MPSSPSIAIVGVTGAVGQEFLRVIDQRDFPYANLKLLASMRSAGKTVEFRGQTFTIEELTETSFADVDLALSQARQAGAGYRHAARGGRARGGRRRTAGGRRR